MVKLWYILRIEPTVFADGLNVEYEKIKEIKLFITKREKTGRGKGLTEEYQLVLTAPLISLRP